MVAAWIRADTGVGPSIASSSQACSGTWADLPHAASRSSRPIAVSVFSERLAGHGGDLRERRRPEGDEEQRDRQAQPDVAHPVDDEGLLRCRRGGVLVLPEADEQVRREADALPAEEQPDVVGREHQHQHRGDEQVEVAEEPATPRVVLHVADGVDVDQRADPGDEEQEQRRQRVVEQVHADAELPGLEPGVQVLTDLAVVGVAAEQPDEHRHAEHEGADRQRGREEVAPLVGVAPADQQDRRTGEGQGDHQPQQGEDAVGRAGVDHRDLVGLLGSSREHGQGHRVHLSTSAGSRRRPRPSDGSGRWS